MTEKQISFRQSSENHPIELQFWIRFLGFILDNILLIFIIMPVVLSGLSYLFNLLDIRLLQATEPSSYNEIFRTHVIFTILIYLLVYGLYTVILESSRLQATFGKLFFRYKVSDLEGNRITFLRALLRYLLKIISICTLIGVWMINFTNRRQGLHDLIVKTIVR